MTPRRNKRSAGPPESNGFIDVGGVRIRPEYAYLANVVTEDDEPVDGLFAERQQRLLAGSVHDSWKGPGRGRPFFCVANVGLFESHKKPPLVPDNLLAVDVAPPPGDLLEKQNHSYFIWLKGKPPDVVIEIVSDKLGGEDGYTLRTYARLQIPYYVIFDPEEHLDAGVLRVLQRRNGDYEPMESYWFPEVGLGVKLWTGPFEGSTDTWLRWCDARGRVIPTGAERADHEKKKSRAAERRAKAAEEDNRRLREQLRRLGGDPKE